MSELTNEPTSEQTRTAPSDAGAPGVTPIAAAGRCRRCQTVIEAGDLRCSVCALTVPEEPRGAAAKPAAKILRCRECSAAVSYTVEKQAPSCAFCGSVMEVEQPIDPVEQAEWILPFTVEYDAAKQALRRWLGSLGWFRPADLASGATVDTLHPLHWAAWIFDAEAQVSWAADSDAGSRRSRWAPHAGTTQFAWDNIVVSASRGLTPKETSRLARGFRLETARPMPKPAGDEAELGGGGAAPGGEAPASTVERFDLQRSAARRKILDAIEEHAAAQLQQRHIPGSRFRNVHTSVLLSRLVTKRMALPTWVLTYRYKGALYRALVHGQDATLAFGEAPLSWTKIALLVFGVLAVLGLAYLMAAIL